MSQPSMELSSISRRAFASFVSEMLGNGSNPNPDDSNPPGPWDPYIRRALNSLRLGFHPDPIPWRGVFGPLPDPWMLEALNPQPLPPKAVFSLALAQQVISHVELVDEIASALARDGEQQGIIIVGGILSRFVDDCGTGMLWHKRPIPPPKTDEDNRLTGLELVVMATQFVQSARATANVALSREFQRTGARLMEMGIDRL